jgi:hypothetical protein
LSGRYRISCGDLIGKLENQDRAGFQSSKAKLSSGFGEKKKWGPRLGSGAPEGVFQLRVSFSHRRVGSSILASLSEAGGNELQKVTSKPLPHHLPIFAVRRLKRAHAALQCTAHANAEKPLGCH